MPTNRVNNKLQTSHVFLDTQVFIAANFQFSSGQLQRLASWSQIGEITLHLTDITLQEIEGKLTEHIDETYQAVKSFKKKAMLLRGMPSFEPLFNFDIEAVKNDFNMRLNDFLKSAKVNVIATNNVSVGTIFDRYFKRKPPFGQGKNKYEFPDAFSIEALENWCIEKGEYMYVISEDNDLESACSSSSSLYLLRKPEELLNLITKSEEGDIYLLGYKCLSQNEEKIQQNTANYFEELGFFLTGADGDVTSITVNSVQLLEKNLVEIQEDALYFEIETEISFSAEVSYPDPEWSVYDSEEEEWIVLKTIQETLEKTENISVKVEMAFSRDDLQNAEVTSISLNTNDIEVEVDKYPYK